MLKALSPFFLLLISLPSLAQKTPIEALKLAYEKSLDEEQACYLSSIDAVSFKDSLYKFDLIILVRHGRPLLNKKGLFTSYMAMEYIDNYDKVNVATIKKSPICIDEISPDTLFTSKLQRSINTAEQIIADRDIKISSQRYFREFELEVFPIPFIRLPLNFWLISARLLWFSGLSSSKIESRKESKERLRYISNQLEYHNEFNNPTILVAHGLLNKALARRLRKNDWELVHQNGMAYLSVKVLAKLR